jgi:hypothetical protein
LWHWREKPAKAFVAVHFHGARYVLQPNLTPVALTVLDATTTWNHITHLLTLLQADDRRVHNIVDRLIVFKTGTTTSSILTPIKFLKTQLLVPALVDQNQMS